MKISTKVMTPMVNYLMPILDESEELDISGVTVYKELIIELIWSIELDRVDILFGVALFSYYQYFPHQGHLEQLLKIFAFLKKNSKLTLYFDPNEPNIVPNTFTGITEL